MKNIKEFKTLWVLLEKKDKIKIIIASIILLVSSVSDILTGYLNGKVVEEITLLNVNRALLFLIIYFIIELVCSGFLSVLSDSIILKIESKLTRKLGYETYKKTLNLPSKAFEKISSGELINRITSDADSLSFNFKRILSTLIFLFGSFVLSIYIFYNSWIVGLEILLFLGLFMLIIKIFNPKLRETHKNRKKEQDRFASLTNESVRGIREVKTLGVKNNLITEMRDLIKEIFKTSKEEIDIQNKYNIFCSALRITLEVGVFITCLILIFQKKTTITFFIAMTYYVYRYMYLMDSINDLSQNYQKVSVSISRVNEILLNKKYNDEKFGNKEIDSKGILEFRNVTFSYPGEKKLLNNFNLRLEPNKKIAIVGKSGQGKSTIFNLATRIFDVNSGEITLDNINIKNLTEKSLRKNISVIRQEPFVFNRTIKDNFKMIDETIKLDEIRKYTKMAYLDDYIMSLPKKYYTLLGEGGVNLSGGQKQRLAIARTLIRNTRVILFDEATSALDNNSQEYIKETIDNLVKDHTVVIVAHRLSTIKDADVIYVVDEGKIVGEGTHKELLKTNKIYKNLYETESLNS